MSVNIFRIIRRINKLCNYKSPSIISANSLKSWTGGIKYHGFKYFPRNEEEHKDPSFEPTKLFMVQRTKPFKGNAYWLKKILCDFNLDGKVGEIAIVKNVPEVNAKLYKIKHLVKITPIKTPDGLPDDPSLGHLGEDGVLTVSKRLTVDPERLKLTEEFQTNPSRLDADTLIKQTRDKWNNPW